MPRVVLITGSTRGIGLAAAKEFLRAGDKVAIFCRHANHVQQATNELSKIKPQNILSLTGDVRDPDDVARVVLQTYSRFRRIDVLINNAGVAVWKDIENTDLDEWSNVMLTNLRGCFLFTKEVLPYMKRQKGGSIINISSGLGLNGSAKYSAYCASKFGIIGLTQVLADEVKGSGIKVYAVCPGGVATKLHLDIHPWEDPEKMMQPEYIGKKILDLAKGSKKSGSIITIYN